MIKCQVCTAEHNDSSQYCDECGSALNGTPKMKPDYDSGAFENKAVEVPSFQPANVTSLGIPAILDDGAIKDLEKESSSHQESNGAHSILVIERGDAVGTEFNLSTEESYIGRWDADNGVFPDVDLDAYDLEAKVSRRHSRIIYTKGKYVIEDLGSTNGTYVNRGRRLIPGNAQLLKDGDEVIVGKIFLRFKVNN